MAKHLKFTGQIRGKYNEIETTLNLIQFKEGKSFIIYAPALEVYGYGMTLKEAKESFQISLIEFINYTTAKGTFKKEMKRMGWKLRKRKNVINYKVPDISEILKNNKELTDMFNNKTIKVYKETIPMAIPATA